MMEVQFTLCIEFSLSWDSFNSFPQKLYCNIPASYCVAGPIELMCGCPIGIDEHSASATFILMNIEHPPMCCGRPYFQHES